MLLAICGLAVAQTTGGTPLPTTVYTNTSLALRFVKPSGMRDKTAGFFIQFRDQSGTFRIFRTLLALSSGPDSRFPNWSSVTVVTYPRRDISESDDAKAAAQMNAWVAHSKGTTALPKSAVISGQGFIVSVFALQKGEVKKGAVVFTTVRKGKLLSFAFAANSAERLEELTESMKTLQFY